MHTRSAKIVVLVTHFESRAAYLENLLAAGLAERSEVHVVTAEIGNSAFQDVAPGESSPINSDVQYSVSKVRVLLQWRQRVWARGLATSLDRISPTGMVLLGPSQVFPAQAAQYAKRRGVPFVVIAGENQQQGPRSSTGKFARQRYVKHVLKPLYAWISKGARGFIALTPETQWVASDAQVMDVRLQALPYDDTAVKYDRHLGCVYRERYGWKMTDEIVLFQGKFERRKNVLGVLDEFDNFCDNSPHARLILVGAGNGAYSHEVRKAADQARNRERIEVLPFMQQRELAGMMNAADVSVWPHVSAGITQTMGAGVYALTARSPISDFLTSGESSALGRNYSPELGGLQSALWGVDYQELRDTRAARADRAKTLYSVANFIDVLWVMLTNGGDTSSS